MIEILIFVGVLALTVQAVIGLAFFISCIWEHEKRATVFALLQFLGMTGVLLLFLYLAWSGFFKTPSGAGLSKTSKVAMAYSSTDSVLKRMRYCLARK